MTSTPDYVATGDICSPDRAARDRFLSLVADARTAVQAALTPPPQVDTGDSQDVDGEGCLHASGDHPSDVAAPSPAQRLEPVVRELLSDGRMVERARVRVAG
ncbi:hypothetical protein [Blastococcus aggregatus]|uniref:hypothetical protein n=1 Tax=Blastococcus aggregatus TaxID=38502 RepID=UPI000BE42399|nr:hypothetical protein [Blastococcus aggregatus]